MHDAARTAWMLLFVVANCNLGGNVSAQQPQPISPQLHQDWNVRRAYDDGSSTLLAPPPPLTAERSPASAPKRRVLPVSFSKHAESDSTMPRDNDSTKADRPLLLAPPSERSQNKTTRPTPSVPKGNLATIFSSLALVLGVFFLVAWFARRVNPNATVTLPKDIVETLGRSPMGNRQYLHLVRVGHKLLLLSVTPNGTETLTEIVEPDEVERITMICQSSQPGSVTTTFRQILSQLGAEPTVPGFLGSSERDEIELANAPSGRRVRRRMARADDE